MAALDYTIIILAVTCLLVAGIGLAVIMRRGYASNLAPKTLTNDADIVRVLGARFEA